MNNLIWVLRCLIQSLLFWSIIKGHSEKSSTPLIVSTWANADFVNAAQTAWNSLIASKGQRRLQALVDGLSKCESLQCDRTVGYGGSPDERGETTLDALLIDGPAHRVGAVAALRRVKNAAQVAWAVMNYTTHTLLVGEKATQFALEMDFYEEYLSTAESEQMHKDWINAKCQPNFWHDVNPDPTTQCGPYKKNSRKSENFWSKVHDDNQSSFGSENHDTIGMIVIDSNGDISAGTSSNGARNKIPGRVGDAPIPGAGAYVDNQIGAAVATGNGDVMMRFSPTYLTVELMRNGYSPKSAARAAIERIQQYYPNFFGAIVAANRMGKFGAACSGIETFSYSMVGVRENGTTRVKTVTC